MLCLISRGCVKLIETERTHIIEDVMYRYYEWGYMEMVVYCQSKWERRMCLILMVYYTERVCGWVGYDLSTGMTGWL